MGNIEVRNQVNACVKLGVERAMSEMTNEQIKTLLLSPFEEIKEELKMERKRNEK
jgi:hypothetical protein